MSRVINFVKKNYVLSACAFIVLILFLTMAIFWIKKGTFSIDDEANDHITLTCPESAAAGEEIKCTIDLSSNFRYKIMSVNANYDFGDDITYVSFGVDDQCEEDKCLEVYASTENGFAVLNENGITSNILVGNLFVRMPSDADANTSYKVGLKTIELAVETDPGTYEMVELEDVAVNVRTLNTTATLSGITLSNATLKEEFQVDRYTYHADVAADVTSITINATKTDPNSTLSGTGSVGEVDLDYGTNTFTITVTAEDGKTTTDYTIIINRGYVFDTHAYLYDAVEGYIYIRYDTPSQMLDNLEGLPNGLTYNVNGNQLEIKNGNEVIQSLKILRFTTSYSISGDMITLEGGTTYSMIMENIVSSDLEFEIMLDGETVTSGSTIINQDYTLYVYYNNDLLEGYMFMSDYLVISDDLIVDNYNGIVKRLTLGTNYGEVLDKFDTNGTISIISNDGETVGQDDIIKTGDIISVEFTNGITLEYKVSVLGDLTGDGEIKINDVSKLYRHLKGRSIIEEEEYLAAGDIISDSSYKINDVSRLYRYLKGRVTSLEAVE